MALGIRLPDKYGLDLDDGNPMSLQLLCFNSVDGSTRFMVVLGWFRFVCANGLIVGTAASSLRGRHLNGRSGAGGKRFRTPTRIRSLPDQPLSISAGTDLLASPRHGLSRADCGEPHTEKV